MNSRPLLRFRRAVPMFVVPIVLGGCVAVQPWQRGNLADPLMQAERDPLHSAMTDHVHFSREASTGGKGVGGGGCGCN